MNHNNFIQYINADHPVPGSYYLTESIDLSEFDQWKPVGNESAPFSVKLKGNYKIISGLKITGKLNNAFSGLFGYLVNSQVERLIIDRPVIEETGRSAAVGAVAGMVKNTTVKEVINHSGKTGTTGNSAHAAGIVGIASHYSTITDNLATGAVYTKGRDSFSGGIAASVLAHSSVLGNLYTGKVTGAVYSSSSGGIAGKLSGHSSAKNNLHTGAITSMSPVSSSDYGGIVGCAKGASTITSNLNSGSLQLSEVWLSTLGGIAGLVENSCSVDRNVNAGVLHIGEGGAFTGGIVGQASNNPVRQNMNNGKITYNLYSKKPVGVGGVGGIVSYGSNLTAENNLNTADIIAGHLVYFYHGTVGGNEIRQRNNLQTGRIIINENSNHTTPPKLKEVPQNKTQPNPQGLDKNLWSSDPEKPFPMLRSINANYQDLLRISNAQNSDFTFPVALKQFAIPGGVANASLLNLVVWNVLNGSRPFLSGVPRQQAIQIGIHCGQGGFACSAENLLTSSTTAPSTASPSSGTQPFTEGCPAPEGIPLAQAYDFTNHQLYVVIRPSSDSSTLTVARYRSTVLDKGFGNCGKITYPLPDIAGWHFIGDSLLMGNSTNRHIHLVANKPGQKPLLLSLSLPENRASEKEAPGNSNEKPDYIMDYLQDSRSEINRMTGNNGMLFFSGHSASNFFIGRFSEKKKKYHSLADLLSDKDSARSLSVSPDNQLLYIAGIEKTTGAAFLRQYSSSTLSRHYPFGINGEVNAITPDNFHSHEAATAVHRGWVYMATITRHGDQLSVRRFDPSNGQTDGSFVIDEALHNYSGDFDTPDTPAEIKLYPDGQHLHVVKYGQKGDIFTTTYDDTKEVYRMNKNLELSNILFSGMIIADRKMYLSYQSGESGSLQTVNIMEINLNNQEVPPGNSSDGFPAWGYGVAIAFPIIAISALAIYIKFQNREANNAVGFMEKMMGTSKGVSLPLNP
ncbi:hypothetical protein [Endozoicomonas euniceicola]|uniref:GLUG domain-containing protein n=1 Tax=Endozoicomonas euniceicola TaxID=1234143 RepID=A0ABY6GVM2_9GAMM|nr:hypothetical protein [Endozoicomonas euniceicola]UYM16449.1 hypothetical protein NX720_00500 [Endozoicomonas euniceicola]